MNTKKVAVVVCVVILILSSIPLWFAEVEEETFQEERDSLDGTPGNPGDGPDCQWGVPGYEPWYYYVGDMINVWCGNLLLPQVDLSVGARGYRMQIVRSYNSHNNLVNGPFGYGWTYNYNLYLTNMGISTSYYDGDGSVHSFSTLDMSNYTSPAGKSLNLTVDPSMLFTLREKTGTNYSFDSSNKLTLVTDQYGNSLNVSYDFMQRITSISDDSNLMLNFTYSGTLISSITDALNRTIQYSYDVFGNLVNVTYPNNGTIQYSYYPDRTMNYTVDQVGRKMRFTYDPLSVFYSRVKNVTYSSIEGGNESTPYESYNLTYGSNYTLVRNARGYSANISLDSNGHPTKIDGPAVGSIFLDVYGFGEALEEPTSCGMGVSSGCSGLGVGKLVMSRLWPRPAEKTYKVFSSRSEVVGIDWDSNFDIRNLTDGLNNTYNFTYDSIHNTVSVIDPSFNSTTYGWQNNISYPVYITLLENLTNARSYSGRYSYALLINGFAPTSYQDPLGNFTYFSVDGFGILATLTDARGKIYQFSYDIHGFPINVTNPLTEVMQFGRDLVGRLSNFTSPGGNMTSYYHSDMDDVIAIVDAMGNATNMTYNLRGDLIGHRDAAGYWTNYTVDAILGEILSVTDPSGYTTSFAYDKVGNLISNTNKRNYTTTVGYDQYNRPTNMTDAAAGVIRIQYNSDGTIANVTDRTNATVYLSYDSNGRVVNMNDPTGNSTKYSHDEVGNTVGVENARGYKAVYSFDALNRLTNRTDQMGNSTTYNYDAVGNVINITDALGYVYEFEYDDLGRTSKETNPLNQSRHYRYDSEGNVINVTNPNGYSTLYEYDSVGRTIGIINARGNKTAFSYDAVGNLLTVVDAENHTTTFAYDELNRLVNTSTPLGNVETLSYDPNGNGVKKQDPNGANTTYQYDALDRLVLVLYPDGENITFQYDAEGRIVQISNTSGYYENRTYDSIGRPTKIELVYGPLNETVSFSYDEVGNKIMVVYPNSYNVTYTYDANDRVIGVSDWTNDSWSVAYDSLDRRTELQYPNGVNATYSYDNASRLESILVRDNSNATLLNLSYTYGAMGNVVSFSDGLGNTTSYVYNEVYQLIQTNYSSDGLTNYTYDGIGNRLNKTHGVNFTTYTYNVENQMIAEGSNNYTYDNNGNIVSKLVAMEFTNYSYSYDNRLVAVQLSNNSVLRYGYSPTGLLIEAEKFNRTTYFVHDILDTHALDDVIASYNESGNITATFIHGPGIDEALKRTENNISIYYHYDLIGSAVLITDSVGNISKRYQYEDFGLPESGDGSKESDPFLFTGREWDNHTKLYYYRARHYDPQLGRFLQKDPVRGVLSSGLNTYAYVENNPVNWVDPSGRWIQYLACFLYAWALSEWLPDEYPLHEVPGEDKFWHAYTGCALRQYGCGFQITHILGVLYEIHSLLVGRPEHASIWDSIAVDWGWMWGNEGRWVTGGWWIFRWREWRPYDCETIMYNHQDTLIWLHQQER